MDTQREIDKKEIMALKDGEKYIIPESDYGLAEIWYINECYFIFSIPMYGGMPQYETIVYERGNKKDCVNKILYNVYSWT